ncbi:MAG: cold shock and DUF1294 domain-containing protein [Campylobacterales bacterium]|nr:cold shock and DUF1294 domain-containing protein [Campylobacterales bacterium]
MMQGIVVKYSEAKGYGFIRTSEREEDIFVHISEVQNADRLTIGQKVDFEIKQTSKGAVAQSVVAGRTALSPSLIYGIIAFVSTLLIALLLQQLPLILNYLIAINITTFLLYGYDKQLAQTDKVRVPERTLHMLALLGGSPAGLIAQRFFRHKTLKSSFQILYWAIVLLQVGVLYFIFLAPPTWL